MIKVIAFDFGGVLGTEADAWETTFKKILDKSNLTSSEMLTIWKDHWPKLKIGKEEIINYWINVAKKENLNPESLRKLYNSLITIDKEMFNLVNTLKSNYKLVILSNDTTDWMNAKIKRFNLDKIFSKIYCSGNLRLSKPDRNIFEFVLHDLRIKPEEMLFIDNQDNNIHVATSLNIPAILFTDKKTLQEKLKLFLQS